MNYFSEDAWLSFKGLSTRITGDTGTFVLS
jgi:hypothetical protein